ncbi:uncharacterized protein LOC134727008 isoform X1 [Mytilus trossulus]|uniref:uncharacterized protein LOC134727008 isoform X1 n=2 Tax=Mytilus trossulus TaxID=6551 RepID=UPI0030060D16
MQVGINCRMGGKENENSLRLPSDAYNYDPDLFNCAKKSVETKSLLPILKDEIKSKIQAKRLSQGLEELKVEFESKPQSPLTEEELEKQNHRKMHNRVSAKKCRWKKKIFYSKKQQELHELEKRNQQLKNTINRIETEKDYYMSKLASSPEIMNICTELYGEPLDILCEIKSDNVLNH